MTKYVLSGIIQKDKEKKMTHVNNNKLLIEKANALSFSEAQGKLTLRQGMLLSFAMLNRPLNEIDASFSRKEFIDFLKLTNYSKASFEVDKDKITDLKYNFKNSEFEDESNEEGGLSGTINLVQFMLYKDGMIHFRFATGIEPFLQNMTGRYMMLDLGVCSKFRHMISWYLYEELKTNYGNKFTNLKQKTYSVEELKKKLHVNDKKTYNNFANFRERLENAIEEINKYTELEIGDSFKGDCGVEYTKAGRTYTEVTINWKVKKIEYGATAKQVEYYNQRVKELLSRKEFTDNPDNAPLVRTFETMDITEKTKEQANMNIKKVDGILKDLNKLLESTSKAVIDLDDIVIREIIKGQAMELLKEYGFNKPSTLDFAFQKWFDSSIESAKINMTHKNSVDSVSVYVAKVLKDILIKLEDINV